MKKFIAFFLVCLLVIPSLSVLCESESPVMASYNDVTNEEIEQLINETAISKFKSEGMTQEKAEEYIQSAVYLDNIKTGYGYLYLKSDSEDYSSLFDLGFNNELGELSKSGGGFTIVPADLSLTQAAKMYIALEKSNEKLSSLDLYIKPGYDESAIYYQITDEEVQLEIEQDREKYDTLMEIQYNGDVRIALSFIKVTVPDLNEHYIWPQELGLDGEIVEIRPMSNTTYNMYEVHFNKDYETLEQAVFDFYKIQLAMKKSEAADNIFHGLLRGDVNGDGSVNAKDNLALRRYNANWEVKINSLNADFDGNGIVNAKDSLAFRKYFANWEV